MQQIGRDGGIDDTSGSGQFADRSGGIFDSSGAAPPPTITSIDPGETTAVVTYTGVANFWRVDGGASSALGVSPATITGLTAGEDYNTPGLEISIDGVVWSTPVAFGTDNPASGGGGPSTAITGSVGQAAATGQAAIINLPTGIQAGLGTASASGLQASIANSTVVAAGVAAAAALGQPAIIALPTAVAAGLGAAQAVGLTATIAISAGIAAGVGAASASGLAASIAQGLVVAGGIAQAQASGQQAGISLGSNVTIAAGVGLAQALGLGAQILASTNIAAAVGAAAAAGLPASIAVATGANIAAGVGVASAAGLTAGVNVLGPLTVGCAVAAADAAGLRAIIRTLGVLPPYAEQPMTSSSWSYSQTATLWSLVSRDDWGGQVTHAEPVLFLCDFRSDKARAVTASGDEFTTRLLIYTSLPGIKQGDMVLMSATGEPDPFKAGADEVRAVKEYADTFRADAPADYLVAT
jgi:hypothetical protein